MVVFFQGRRSSCAVKQKLFAAKFEGVIQPLWFGLVLEHIQVKVGYTDIRLQEEYTLVNQ